MILEHVKLKSYFSVEIRKKLNRWESKFISSLFKSRNDFTVKQKLVLNKLVKKYQLVQQVVVEKIIHLPTGTPEGYSQQHITSREYRRKQHIKRKLTYGKRN